MSYQIKLAKILMVLCIVFCVQFTQGQNSFLPFSSSKQSSPNSSSLPERNSEIISAKSLNLAYQFPGAFVSNVTKKGDRYSFLNIEGFSKNQQPGAPAVPMRIEMIAFPRGSKINLEITKPSYIEYDGYQIHPALEPAVDTEGAPSPEFKKDESIYSKNAFYPENVIEIIEVNYNRGTPIASVRICPVQFNPVTGKIRVYPSLQCQISGSGGENDFNYINEENSKTYIKNFKRSILNKESIPQTSESKKTFNPTDAKNYIIITHDAYSTDALRLANWKRQLGYSAALITKSSWTADEVKDTVHYLYNNWTPKPDYLLIIGDHDGSYAVPGEIRMKDEDPTELFASDLYAVCMDGTTDYYPDMAKGRISVSSAAEATVVVNKIINYEKTPPTSSSFYDNVLNCAQFQDKKDTSDMADGYATRRFCHTSEEIRDYLQDEQDYNSTRVYYTADTINPTNYNNGYYSDGQAIPSDLLRSNGFTWTGNKDSIRDNINEGKFLLFHRDHGFSGGSGWAHPYFTTSSIDELSNNSLLPVVFSINCHTGAFLQSNCFAEKFLRVENKGAVGVIAASYTSYSGYNDALAIGMIDAIWPAPGLYPNFGPDVSFAPNGSYTIGAGNEIYTMGDVVNQGLHAMTQNFYTSQYTYELFHYFGDPAMKIHTANPNDSIIIATHASSIHCDEFSFAISGSTPYATATLTCANELVGKVELDASGNGNLPYLLTNPGDVTVTISKHNHVPYVDEIIQICTGYPPIVVADSSGSITKNSAILYGKVTNNSGSLILENGFVISESNNPTLDSPEALKVVSTTVNPTGTFNSTVNNLDSETPYYFRSFAINANGTAYSETKYFETDPFFEYSEDFSSLTLPAGWSIVDHLASGGTWEIRTNLPNYTVSVYTTTEDNGFAILDSDGYGSGNSQDCDLISAEFDFSNCTNINVKFDQYFRNFTDEQGIFSYSIDGKSSWPILKSWLMSGEGSDDTPYNEDLTSILENQASVYFKWTYIGDWGYYWVIDDILITAEQMLSSTNNLASGTYNDADGCYDATDTITVGGSGDLTFASGSTINLIAGQSINFLPGFHAESGAQMNAWITDDDSFCNAQTALDEHYTPVVVTNSRNKSTELESKRDEINDLVQTEIKVYPNPNNGQFTVSINNIEANTEIYIFNATGSLIKYQSNSGTANHFNLIDVPKGMYFVKVKEGIKLHIEKVIIQ